MARKARNKILYGHYLVEQHGPADHKLFSMDEERNTLLETLEKVKKKYNFKLYAVSLTENSYKLLLFDNGNDLSKILKSINISFAMKYKCNHENCTAIFLRNASKVL